jgi:transposase InsO family protein
MLDKRKQSPPVGRQCDLLGLSRSTAYYRPQTDPARQAFELKLLALIDQLYTDRPTRGRGGLRDALAEEHGLAVNPKRIRRLMQKLGIEAIYPKPRKNTSAANKQHKKYPYLLNALKINRPDQVWCADITYIRLAGGFVYLAAVMDLFSRRIVGWAASGRINEELVTAALQDAIARRHPEPGLLHHSDRGSQYASYGYQELLEKMQMICSMSRKSDCWDNAVMERFFGSLKSERTDRRIYQTREQAKKDLFDYIEWFYNTGRRHEALGYMTPAAFEKQYQKERNVA